MVNQKHTNLIQQWGGKTALFFAGLHLGHDLTTGLLVALLPFVRQDLGLNYLQAGLLTSAYSLTSGVSQLFGGWISDRIDRKKAMAIGLAGVGISAVGIGFSPNYYTILAILIIQGILAGFFHPSAVASITGCYEETRRGKAIAIHMLGGTIGYFIGPSLGAVISASLTWHYAFVILASFFVRGLDKDYFMARICSLGSGQRFFLELIFRYLIAFSGNAFFFRCFGGVCIFLFPGFHPSTALGVK